MVNDLNGKIFTYFLFADLLVIHKKKVQYPHKKT